MDYTFKDPKKRERNNNQNFDLKMDNEINAAKNS